MNWPALTLHFRTINPNRLSGGGLFSWGTQIKTQAQWEPLLQAGGDQAIPLSYPHTPWQVLHGGGQLQGCAIPIREVSEDEQASDG